MAHIVVIGAGQAGFSLAAKLRNLGYQGRLSLFGEETAPPYQRPPLSKKYLLGAMDVERLFLRPAAFYGTQDITLRLNHKVTALNPAKKQITVNGAEVSYDQLAFATGSIPQRLPAAMGGDLAGVYTVRTLADIDRMAPEFAPKRHVLVVGGGYIGLEAAAVAASLGLRVTLIEMGARILQRVAAPETSDFFRDLHQSHGVDIREGTGLAGLSGESHVAHAELSDGTRLDVDFVIVGAGIRPATDLAESAGLAIDNGIKTDAFGKTSQSGIWAAGDCASFRFKGRRIRLESVPNAIDQAEAVAANMLGANTEYVAKPWFWSDQYDVKLQIAGLNTGYDTVFVRKNGTARSVWYYKGADLLAVDAMNDARAYMIGKRLIEAGRSPEGRLVEDSATDLKTLLG